MTRKDYVAIAAAIKAHTYSSNAEINTRNAAEGTRQHIAEELADVMARENPRFDRARFLAACGVQS